MILFKDAQHNETIPVPVLERVTTANSFRHAFLCLILCLASISSTAAEPVLSENQAKAALLYNFIKHTQWPNENDIPEFKVAFLGSEDNFFNEFDSIAHEISVRGKKVSALQVSTPIQPAKWQVLVVSPAMNYKLKDIASILLRSGTLLVSTKATDKKLVMINFIYPEKETLSFEINKSNIVYDGLKISNDVLLHGGSEIEVATLYKEMEFLLHKIKDEVEENRSDLQQKMADIDRKNGEILTLKEKATSIATLLASQTTKMNEQQTKLSQLNEELDNIKNHLSSSQTLLNKREQLVANLEVEINRNKDTLKQQEREIEAQQQLVAEKSETVTLQGETITSQRNIIFAAMLLLLILLLLIINRQKQALSRQRQLVETKAALILAQEESIKAYESSIKLKNDFLTAISHEMRTPMNGIIGAVQIADNSDLSSMRASMDMIGKSSTEMINLVDSILTYIEIQSEQIAIINESICIPELFEALREQYTQPCREKNLQLNWHVSDNFPEWLNIDKNKFTKILQKLLDNAIKFTDKGAITMIARYQSINGQDCIICTVKDTGQGIPQTKQEHIYDAFWQQETGLTRRFTGLGIGLTICQKLIELMHGTIEMSSMDGQGSQFTVTFHLPEAPVVIPPANLQITSEIVRPVLIVEDNIINQQVLQMMLSKLNYPALIANDGIEALEIIDRQIPSIILMDLQMPNMDGFSCTRAIRARTDEVSRVPIIAITANLMECQQINCIEAGMNGYLGKPIEMRQLDSMLQQFIALHHAAPATLHQQSE